jgi:radical SAM superfamily enzyme YgiQ (UPF0313 family)
MFNATHIACSQASPGRRGDHRVERIVFFQPRTLAGDNYLNSNREEQRWAPWAALLLSPTILRTGLSVALIDARVSSSTWTEDVASLTASDLLAVSVMTGHAIRDAVQASRIAHERGSRVIWGGPHVTLFPEKTLRQAPVDAVLPGFGYAPMSQLMAFLQKGEWPDNHIGGVFVDEDSSWPGIAAGRQAYGTIGGALDPPDLDLIGDWQHYLNADVAIADRTVNFITSEGCERRCTYCSEPRTSGMRWLARDVERSVAVAKDLITRSGANGLKLHDPNFFHDMPRALAFARQFSRNVGVPWAATMHPADLAAVPGDVLDELAQLGLARVLVGLESPDPKLVRLAGKEYDPITIPQLVSKLAHARIRGMFTFIVGWPDAADDHYSRTIECAFSIRKAWEEHQAKIHFLEPWPGTPIFNLLVKRGVQHPATLTEWADIDYYQARYAAIHNQTKVREVRAANKELSPYVDA